jgi:hypothetical protein
MNMFRKINAYVTEKDFFDFCQRARIEGLTVDEAFTAITHAYAKGAKIDLKKFKVEREHHVSTGAEYGKTRD